MKIPQIGTKKPLKDKQAVKKLALLIVELAMHKLMSN